MIHIKDQRPTPEQKLVDAPIGRQFTCKPLNELEGEEWLMYKLNHIGTPYPSLYLIMAIKFGKHWESAYRQLTPHHDAIAYNYKEVDITLSIEEKKI